MTTRLSRIAALASVLAAALPGLAAADHWRQTADPQVVQALDELAWVYGQFCQQGNPQACHALQSVQQEGAMMLNAGYDCQVQGNPQACAYYQHAYSALSMAYGQVRQALSQGALSPPAAAGGGANPLGATHAERMATIQQWGQERLQWGADRAAQMERQNQQFLESLRN